MNARGNSETNKNKAFEMPDNNTRKQRKSLKDSLDDEFDRAIPLVDDNPIEFENK
jgi:hypothetical protein